MFTAALLFACLAEPDWPTRNLEVGQTVIYSGDCTDTSERPGRRFRHVYSIETSLTVFAIKDGVAECAVMTVVTPNAEKSIVNAAIHISGRADSAPVKPVIRVEWIRFHANGRLERAVRPTKPPPFSAMTYSDFEGPPLDGPPVMEFGPFARLAGVKQPKLEWERQADELWNGSRVFDFVGRQSTPDFDDLTKAVAGWRRTDRQFISPLDGLPRAIVRTVEQREGKQIISTHETKLTMQPPQPVLGPADLRRAKVEAEFAAWFGAEADRVVRDRQAMIQFQDQVKRFIASQADATRFRPALDCFVR